LLGGLHHMGTTRMSADPRSGVVDRDCRVHGIGNLYVAGASVFPTVGWANPTMTVVALALRLASHVTDLLAAPVTLTSPQAATALEAAQ
jgi:choline dehydrogenase-like flavoprotein